MGATGTRNNTVSEPNYKVVIPAKERESSLKDAIALAKRNLRNEKYAIREVLEDAAYNNYLRRDELYTLQSEMADYLTKPRYIKGLEGEKVEQLPLYTTELGISKEDREKKVKQLLRDNLITEVLRKGY